MKKLTRNVTNLLQCVIIINSTFNFIFVSFWIVVRFKTCLFCRTCFIMKISSYLYSTGTFLLLSKQYNSGPSRVQSYSWWALIQNWSICTCQVDGWSELIQRIQFHYMWRYFINSNYSLCGFLWLYNNFMVTIIRRFSWSSGQNVCLMSILPSLIIFFHDK